MRRNAMSFGRQIKACGAVTVTEIGFHKFIGNLSWKTATIFPTGLISYALGAKAAIVVILLIFMIRHRMRSRGPE